MKNNNDFIPQLISSICHDRRGICDLIKSANFAYEAKFQLEILLNSNYQGKIRTKQVISLLYLKLQRVSQKFKLDYSIFN